MIVMLEWLWGMAALMLGGFGARVWYRARQRKRAAARRRVEAPNSHYSSAGVRNQEDRERWGSIDLRVLHPLNGEEVMRLLRRIDADGIGSISSKDRMFLDNMTLPRRG